MSLFDPAATPENLRSTDPNNRFSDSDLELRLSTRHSFEVEDAAGASLPPSPTKRHRGFTALIRVVAILLILAILLGVGGFFAAEHFIRSATRAALPQIDGTLSIAGLSAPVTVQRDAHGVPQITAASVDDLLIAQGFITAQDRLFQMDTLRRHAAGELAEILGPTLIPHDRLQRTLQMRAAADRAVAQLPPEQLHMLEQYAKGVNALIQAQSGAQTGTSNHLPIEFRVLRYQPAPWTPRDSLLCYLAMFEDLTNTFPTKLAREALTARLPADLVPDLYPVGSWRDHPPSVPNPDLTIPGPPIEQVPLDESQATLHPPPSTPPPSLPSSLFPLPCTSCTPGSNNYLVSGAHTASGKPLLANDMHLNLLVPDIWYEAVLTASIHGSEPLQVSGVSIPGLPLIVVGQNRHIAWGFTNLGGDVQDVYIETTRGSGSSQEFLTPAGTWQPVTHIPELIKVHGGRDETLDVTATRHGDTLTPVLTPILTNETRTLALRWTLYDPTVLHVPQMLFATAHDWPTFLAALDEFRGPAQNVVYADDQGHIGYHAAGRIPLRGPARDPAIAEPLPTDIASPQPAPSATETPIIRKTPDPLNASPIATTAPGPSLLASGPLSPVPLVPTAASEWSGYIPFDKLPQVYDPPGGIIATANSRVTPDGYPYPITDDWASAYRTERIWRLLANRTGMTPADMLAIQSDIYSDLDRVLAQRIAYAVDHSQQVKSSKPPQLLLAADLLRAFDGQMTADSPAAAIVSCVHATLWRVLLEPRLSPAPQVNQSGSRQATTINPTAKVDSRSANAEFNRIYTWGERDYALEQIVMHTPPRWLPPAYTNWDDLLAAALDQALKESHAPADLSRWHYGAIHTVDLEHPIFSQSPLLQRLIGMPTGTGNKPQSGDATTIKQVGHAFGPSERFSADLGNPTPPPSTSPQANPATPPAPGTSTSSPPGTTSPPSPSSPHPSPTP